MGEQVIDADDFAGVFGEAHQQPYRPHFYSTSLAVT